MSRGALAGILLLPWIVALAPAGGQSPCDGSFAGRFDGPVHVAATGPEWQPHDLPWSADQLAQLASLELVLHWNNTPDSAADLGIAAGDEQEFRYWNQEFQTSYGAHSERIRFERGEMDEYGWTGLDRLQVGPSISTGGYGAAPVAYRLDWSGAFQDGTDAACTGGEAAGDEGAEGAVRDPGRGPGDGEAGDGAMDLPRPLRWALLALTAGAVVVVAAMLATRGRA